MDERPTSYISRSSRCLLVFFLSLSTILASTPVLAGRGVVPQQSGAVPLSQGVTDLASQMAKEIPQGRTMTIAVTDFPDNRKRVCGLGQFVAERLSTLLSRYPQCRLIERHRLDMVLDELKFSMSELVDPAKARKLGQMLGVQGLVVGTVTDLGATFEVDARIIDIQTDVSMRGAAASIIKDDAAKQLSSDCAASAPPKPLGTDGPETGTHGGETTPQSQPTNTTVRLGEFSITIRGCRRSGEEVTCSGSVTNKGSERDSFAFINDSYLVDNLGNQSRGYPRIAFGRYGGSDDLEPDLPMNFSIKFMGIASQATKVTAVLDCQPGGRSREQKATVRNIPLQ